MTDTLMLPEPPVPADLDLRKLHSFMLNRDRLLASELWAIATGEEFKAWFALVMRAWHEVPAGSLPDNDRILAGFSGAGARWPKVKAVALHGWVLHADGRYYHMVLVEDVLRAAAHQERHEDANRGAAERVRRYRERQRGEKAARGGGGETLYETPPAMGDETGKVTRYDTARKRVRNGSVTRNVLARIDNDTDIPPKPPGVVTPSGVTPGTVMSVEAMLAEEQAVAEKWRTGDRDAAWFQAMLEQRLSGQRYDQSDVQARKNELLAEFEASGTVPPIRRAVSHEGRRTA